MQLMHFSIDNTVKLGFRSRFRPNIISFKFIGTQMDNFTIDIHSQIYFEFNNSKMINKLNQENLEKQFLL